MFKPEPMRQLSVVVLERDERAVLQALGSLGAVQLLRTRSGPDTAPLAPADQTAGLARCERLLARVEELRRALELAPSPAEATAGNAMALDEAEETLRLLQERAGVVVRRRQRLVRRWGELTALGEQAARYAGLGIPLEPEERSSFLHFVLGSLPAENLEALQKEVGDNVALLPLAVEKGRQPLLAMTTRRGRPALDKALQAAGFQHESLPAVEGGTVDTLAATSLQEQEATAAELKQVNEQMRTLAAEAVRPLQQIEQLAVIERCLLEAAQNFPRTEAAVLVKGWVAAADAPALERCLREITGGRCAVETLEPVDTPEEQVPILLRHARLLRPFQRLVAAYGLPRYRELEPTLFVAVSYVLMFGIMFGDAGQGAVLALAGLGASLAGRTEKVRDVGLLLLFSGLSSAVFGLLYGSCFGLPAFKKHAFWRDPLEGDPMGLIYGALGLGVVMISLGLVLNVINRFRRGDVLGGLLDKFGAVGVLFYWGALVLVTRSAALASRGLMNLAVLLFLVVPIAGWAVKEPLEYALRRRAGHRTEPGAGLGAAITESLVGAFEAVLSYLANTISFVRLAAYAMSHAALLVAAFMMAAAVKQVSPGGGLLSALVIVLGNLVAIALEGIIASVQALRLEYYEFFGKFFSGSGQAFRPFRLAANGQGTAGMQQ